MISFCLSKSFVKEEKYIYPKAQNLFDHGKIKYKGGQKMNVTFCKTKAGNGFKIAIDNVWLYASKEKLLQVLNGEAKSCQFRTMDNSPNSEFEDPFEDSSKDESH